MPRRRFSQGAIQPIREMLQEIEDEENMQVQLEKEELKRNRLEQQKKMTKKKAKKKHEKTVKQKSNKRIKIKTKVYKNNDIEEDEDGSTCNTDDDFTDLPREEQLERLQEGDTKSSGNLHKIPIFTLLLSN